MYLPTIKKWNNFAYKTELKEILKSKGTYTPTIVWSAVVAMVCITLRDRYSTNMIIAAILIALVIGFIETPILLLKDKIAMIKAQKKFEEELKEINEKME